MKKIFLTLSLAILLYGCATPYKPYGLGGDYKDIQLDSNTFTVSFRGNGLTSKETVEAYLLYRCAEITVNHGYDYFVVVKGGSQTLKSRVTTPGAYTSTTNGYFSGYNYGNSGYSFGNGYGTA